MHKYPFPKTVNILHSTFGINFRTLSPYSRVFLEKLTGFQLVKKFPAFYGTRRLITAVTPAHILSQLDPDHTPTFYFLKIHLNIILPSMLGSPKWSLFLRLSHQTPVYASLLPHPRYMPRQSNFFSILSPEK